MYVGFVALPGSFREKLPPSLPPNLSSSMSWIDVKLPVYPCHRKWDLNSGFNERPFWVYEKPPKKTWMDVASNQPTHKYTHNLRIFDTNRRVIHRIFFLHICVCVRNKRSVVYDTNSRCPVLSSEFPNKLLDLFEISSVHWQINCLEAPRRK